MLVDESLLPVAEALAPYAPNVKGWIVMTDKHLPAISTSLPGVHHFENLMAAADTEIGWPLIDETSAYISSLDVKPDLSRARLLSGATEPPLSLMRGLHETTGADVIHAYGATETTPLVAINYGIKSTLDGKLTREQRWDRKRYQGLMVSGVDYRLVDDRIKDVIKSGGESISSIDMENVITSHPQLREAAVIGVEHPTWQERPVVIAVTDDGTEVPLAEIHALLPAFAKWQLPDTVIYVDALPRTSVGKIDKNTLRAAHAGTYRTTA